MDNMKRCPQCHLQPMIDMGEINVTIQCHQHGYIAQGQTLEKAVEYWNKFIDFVGTSS